MLFDYGDFFFLHLQLRIQPYLPEINNKTTYFFISDFRLDVIVLSFWEIILALFIF